MSAEQFIASRFMLKGGARGRPGLLTLFSWLAIGVGVGAMSCLLAVMYGFEGALRDRVLTAFPHVLIHTEGSQRPIADHEDITNELSKLSVIERLAPYIETEQIIQSDYRAIGAIVLGVSEKEMIARGGEVTEGAIPAAGADIPQVMLGQELARRLAVDRGDLIKLISPVQSTGALGIIPKSLAFEVVGIYKSGHYDFDEQYLLMPLTEAQQLLRRGDVITGWQAWGEDLESADQLKQSIAAVLPKDLQAQSWMEFNAALFQSLKLEQFSMFTIFTLAILIAAMNIGITLMMNVSQKRRNIGILRAMGATKQQVRRVFLWQASLLGGGGLLLGAFITVGFLIYIKFFSTLQLPAIYYDRSIPVEIRPWSLALVYVIAIVMIFLSTLYPAKKAMEVHPIEAIRE